MRKLLLAIGTAAAVAALTTPSFSMGGGGGGGGGTNYGGGSMGGPTFDEYAQGVRLVKHEKYSEAIPHLLMAVSEKPNNADALNYLGYSNRMLGNFDVSLSYYQRALAINPDHKGVHEYLGELYLQKHDLPSAQKELDTLAALCPSGCDERDTLTKAIAAYAPPADAAAPAAASPAPAGGSSGN